MKGEYQSPDFGLPTLLMASMSVLILVLCIVCIVLAVLRCRGECYPTFVKNTKPVKNCGALKGITH